MSPLLLIPLLILAPHLAQAIAIDRGCLSDAWDRTTVMYHAKLGCSGSKCGECGLQESSSSDGDDVELGEFGVAIFACTVTADKGGPVYYYIAKIGLPYAPGTCRMRINLDAVRPKNVPGTLLMHDASAGGCDLPHRPCDQT